MYTEHTGGTATCQTKGECAICGAEYLADHDFSVPDYKYVDDMKCATYCANCDEISSWSYHEGGISTCQQKSVCEICHHEYGDFAPCSGGTATCTEQAVCATCGEKYGEILPHDYGTAWKSDEDEHWNECACGDKANKAAHTDDNDDGKCDECERVVGGEDGTEPGDDTNTEDSTDHGCGGCGSSFGAGAAIIVAICGLAVFMIDKKKKH